MAAARQDFQIEHGIALTRVLRWESGPIIYKPITAIAAVAPAQITCPAHGVPAGWRVVVVSVKGMTQINAKSLPPAAGDHHQATVVDANTLTLNDVNAAGFAQYATGGYVRYNTPVPLAGATATLTVWDKAGGAVLLTLTESSGITLDNTAKTITITFPGSPTWKAGVYELVVTSGGVPTALLEGKITVSPSGTLA